MFCSTVIPTIGRPTLNRAVESVLNQEFAADDFEVVVVNDSGQELPYLDWQNSPRVTVIETNRRNRSIARNAGASVARGKYLHFLDDDDWMTPDAFCSFWELATTNNAAWLYGAFRLVDSSGDILTDIYPDESGNTLIQLLAFEWIPIQASLIDSKAFFSVGGFSSVGHFSESFQDVDLSRMIVLNHAMAGCTHLVATIRFGDEGSTTSYWRMQAQHRISREKVLASPGAFSRLRDSAMSANSDKDYWRGRLLHYYLASTKRNLTQKRLTTAISRAYYSAASLITAGRHIWKSGYRQGALRQHFNRVEIAIGKRGSQLYSNTH